MKRNTCLMLLLVGLAALFSGCTTVQPWENLFAGRRAVHHGVHYESGGWD